MIDEIDISELGIISQATLPLGSGLTVLTGETGAGKTMVLSAIAMLRGAKPAAGLLAEDGTKVVGRWLLGESTAATRARQLVAAAGGEITDDELIVIRTSKSGRTRAHLGGVPVPATVLSDVIAELVAVHGQSDQLRLRSSAAQRATLDDFGGPALAAARDTYQSAFHHWQALTAELDERQSQAQQRAAEAEFLRFGLDEINAVNPSAGEDDELKVEADRLANLGDIAQACELATTLLNQDENSAVSLAAQAAAQLHHNARYEAALGEYAIQIDQAVAILNDIATEISGLSSDLNADPERMAYVQSRLAVITRLGRKYGPSAAGIVHWAATSQARLADLDLDTSRIDELAIEIAAAEQAVVEAGLHLHRIRVAAAEQLSQCVTEELQGLAMASATFVAQVIPASDPEGVVVPELATEPLRLASHGLDQVRFGLMAHDQADVTDLGKGASGGELSRIMLALEVVAASEDSAPTMVFDEIDAGVGGKAAVEIGRRLQRLAADRQVIVVTHLAQVAAFADTQLVVTKSANSASTQTTVAPVSGDERVTEIARMLSGQEDSDHARAHAVELLDMGLAMRNRKD